MCREKGRNDTCCGNLLELVLSGRLCVNEDGTQVRIRTGSDRRNNGIKVLVYRPVAIGMGNDLYPFAEGALRDPGQPLIGIDGIARIQTALAGGRNVVRPGEPGCLALGRAVKNELYAGASSRSRLAPSWTRV